MNSPTLDLIAAMPRVPKPVTHEQVNRSRNRARVDKQQREQKRTRRILRVAAEVLKDPNRPAPTHQAAKNVIRDQDRRYTSRFARHAAKQSGNALNREKRVKKLAQKGVQE